MRTSISVSELDNDPSGHSKCKVFGNVAERLIGEDFKRKIPYAQSEIFNDNDNRDAELREFLLRNNRALTRNQVDGFMKYCKANKMMRYPDLLVHTSSCQEFYEIKPNSGSGRRAGRGKLKIFKDVYKKHKFIYQAGFQYNPNLYQCIAKYEDIISVFFRVTKADDGLLLYDMTVDFEENAASSQYRNSYKVMVFDLIRHIAFDRLNGLNTPLTRPIRLYDEDVARLFYRRQRVF